MEQVEEENQRGQGNPDSSKKQPLRQKKLECGPMPNVMAALPNIGGALCSTLQSLADAHYQSPVQ